MKIKLTIFTPTYNRVELIKNLYQSLLKQKFKEYEWLIIDDGSTDNTKEEIEKLQSEKKIEIKYYYKENGGKHTAYNLAIDKARGELFVIVDSDDYILENGFFEIIKVWESLDNREKLLGISGVDLDRNLKIIGDYYPREMICSHLEMREVYKIKGDKTEIFDTQKLRGNHFPIYENERFLTEAILFDKLYNKYNSYFINIPLIIRDYQVGGLTDNILKLRVQNPIGAMEYYKQNIELCKTQRKKIKSKLNYYRFYYHKNRGRNFKFNLYSIIGYCIYNFDKRKLKKKYGK